ncbi:MAG TPA: hypothetical protein VL326_19175 [Kofleriaceae bacterium]|nr:hypothetical protein [Kofleriaceae bacterium]
MKLLIAIAVVLTGCMPTLSAGIDSHTTMSGPIKNLTTQPVATARSEDAPPVENTRSYSFAAGFKLHRFGVEFGLHLHDVKGASFSVPSEASWDPTSPRYLITTGSLDFRIRWLEFKHFASDVHAGPAGGFLVDRGTAGTDFGQGFRLGAAVATVLGPLNAFADFYLLDMVYIDGPAKGGTKMSGVTLGFAFR